MSDRDYATWLIIAAGGLVLMRVVLAFLADTYRDRPVVIQDVDGRWRAARYVREGRPFRSSIHRSR